MHEKVVFLDRDGVINRDSKAYIKHPDEFHFLPGSLNAMVELAENGFAVMIVTNQSAVNRGIIRIAMLERIHDHMRSEVGSQGGHIRDIFFCPHRPDEGCDCRKPKPEMILRAQRKYGIDLAASVMVGDRARDILCGKNAGCGRTVLVKTGYGKAAAEELAARDAFPDHIAENLSQSIAWIVQTAPIRRP